jgi:hypothetical protein
MRSYIPASTPGYGGYLRVINTSNVATPVNVSVIEGASGMVGAAGGLTSLLPAGAAVTYTASAIEQALGYSIAGTSRPRVRIATQSPVEVQSFMSNPGNIFTQLSGAQTGSTVDVRTYVPWAANTSGYISYLRVINTATTTTAVRVAVIDGDTGVVGASAILDANVLPGAAITYTAQQVEAALGISLPVAARPRIRVTSTTPIDVQSFMSNPGGVFTETSSVQ